MAKNVLSVLAVIFLLFLNELKAQNTPPVHQKQVSLRSYQIKGIVRDSQTLETLPGATIAVKSNVSKATSTDIDGKYSLTLTEGKHILVCNYMGYEEQEFEIFCSGNLNKNIMLKASTYELQEIVVSSHPKDANVSSPQTGVERLEIGEINKLPVLLGERDILKAIQLTPGVKSAGEGSTGFFVRGGTADQNLILLDDVPLYNVSHLMGFFSTFNSDVLSNVSLYKGSMPAQYGERLASILDVQQRDGDVQRYRVAGSLGLISSKLNVEGPIQKGKSSFIIGARRTYADAIAKLAGKMKGNSLYFYDLNMKLNLSLSNKDRLSVSGYMGRDVIGVADLADIDWGNRFLSLKWNRSMNNKWISNTTLFYNQYDYSYSTSLGMHNSIQSKITDFGLKQEFLFLPDSNNTIRFGIQSTYHNLAPGKYNFSSGQSYSLKLHNRYSLENAFYASNQMKISDNLEVIYGLRLSAFMALGNGEYYTLDDNREVIDSKWHKSGEVVKTYLNLEPRVSGVYKLDDVSSIKTAYARTSQNMHLMAYNSMGLTSDRWASSSNNIKPQIADQFSLGYFRNFKDNMFEFSVEAYYKNMQNQIDFKDNADFEQKNAVETELLFGKGRAFGVEFLLKKKSGRFTGWIGYTLSKSEKKINGINNNQWYDAIQDRTHDVSIVGVYELSKKWTFSAAWVYYTGNAITYPSGKYQMNGNNVVYYSERNGYRAPAYHRLDLGATRTLKKTAKYESELNFSLYNAYGRENPYMIRFTTDNDDPNRTTAYQYALFRFIPSISWNFKF